MWGGAHVFREAHALWMMSRGLLILHSTLRQIQATGCTEHHTGSAPKWIVAMRFSHSSNSLSINHRLDVGWTTVCWAQCFLITILWKTAVIELHEFLILLSKGFLNAYWSLDSQQRSPVLKHLSLDIKFLGASGWLSGWVFAFGSGRDPGVLGSSPTLGALHEACFSLCLLSLPFSLSLSFCDSHK